MIRYLKRGPDAEETAEADGQIRATVEQIIDDIAKRGDNAVREYSVKFDNWSRPSFRLSQGEIESCLGLLSKQDRQDRQDRQDIDFAPAQVRKFAEHQPRALTDIELETLPGVVLGHKNIPVNSVGAVTSPGGGRCRRRSDGQIDRMAY